VLDGDGTQATFVCNPPGQPTPNSLGLTAYAGQWYEAQATMEMVDAMDTGDDD
jgi:hypothetical protein